MICKQGNPTATADQQARRRVARELKAAGWRLERVLSDNGNEFRGTDVHQHPRAARRPPQPHPRRAPTNQRQRRSAPQDDPRRVLATSVRPLHLPPLHRAATRARHLPALLQQRPRPPRPPHTRTHPRRHRLRCPQDGGQMSRTCRHISESAHFRRRVPRRAASEAAALLRTGAAGSRRPARRTGWSVAACVCSIPGRAYLRRQHFAVPGEQVQAFAVERPRLRVAGVVGRELVQRAVAVERVQREHPLQVDRVVLGREVQQVAEAVSDGARQLLRPVRTARLSPAAGRAAPARRSEGPRCSRSGWRRCCWPHTARWRG